MSNNSNTSRSCPNTCEPDRCNPAKINHNMSGALVGTLSGSCMIPKLGGSTLLTGNRPPMTIIEGMLVSTTQLCEGHSILTISNISNQSITLMINGSFNLAANGVGFIARIAVHALHNGTILATTSPSTIGASTTINGGVCCMNVLFALDRGGIVAFNCNLLASEDACNCSPTLTKDICVAVSYDHVCTAWINSNN